MVVPKNVIYESFINFMIEYDSKVVPIEVKAGDNFYAKSLKFFIDKFDTSINIRSSMLNYEVNNNLYNIPLYLIGNFDKYINN